MRALNYVLCNLSIHFSRVYICVCTVKSMPKPKLKALNPLPYMKKTYGKLLTEEMCLLSIKLKEFIILYNIYGGKAERDRERQKTRIKDENTFTEK